MNETPTTASAGTPTSDKREAAPDGAARGDSSRPAAADTPRPAAADAPRPAPPGGGRPPLEWSELDRRMVDLARTLAMDAVEESGSGHPGTAMSLAPAACLLYSRLLRHDPTEPDWVGRDRFVLSCGHSSLTLYIQLYLTGYGLALDDIKSYRMWNSRTPGHPEHAHTLGVETTTGPLGQGVGNAVGMAMAARRERGLFDPDAEPGASPFDHTIWVFASDGDMQEGVASEASSLAGHQRLGNLVLLYDDNGISIEGETNVAFSEDVLGRYRAYGWHTARVEDAEDVDALYAALVAARDETSRPSIVAVRSVIAYPAPKAQNTGKAHGAPLGPEEVAATKKILGLDPDKRFDVPDDVLRHARQVIRRGQELRREWEKGWLGWQEANPERLALWERVMHRRLPDAWEDALPTFPADKPMATRKASGEVLSAIGRVLPELWGGSADLAESNNTTMTDADSFLPVETGAKRANPYGRTLHFGIREHAMGSILNGIALHGPTRPYGGTFLVFSDYMRPAVRLAALMRLPVVYVWTHDSIGLGEDGPTHQPVEQLAALRAIPGLAVVRPGDANETAEAWHAILERHDGPAALCLTRQNVPTFDRSPATGIEVAEGVARGAYVLRDAENRQPRVILIATGSEVSVAMEGAERLAAEGVPTRVVSMPCREWFLEQEPAYQQLLLPPEVEARVSVEAGVSMGWRDIIGTFGETISLEHFGASAPYKVLFEQFGITSDRVVAAAHASLNRLHVIKGEPTGN